MSLPNRCFECEELAGDLAQAKAERDKWRELAGKIAKPLQAFLSFQGECGRDITCMGGLERTKYEVGKEALALYDQATKEGKV